MTEATQALLPVTIPNEIWRKVDELSGYTSQPNSTMEWAQYTDRLRCALAETLLERQSHSLPGDVGTAEALAFIDKFFEPWGSWKTVWWEGEVSDDAAFSADNALKHVANILRLAALTPSALSGGEVE